MATEPVEKTRVLLYGDYGCATGFATVTGNIARELVKDPSIELSVLGVNHYGDPLDPQKWPGRVWPAMTAGNMQGAYADFHGRQRLIDILSRGNFDVLFMVMDTFIVQAMMPALKETQKNHPSKFKMVYYFPIDCTPKKDWITECVSLTDHPVVYTNYGKAEVSKIDSNLKDIPVIYHGNNFNDYFPIEEKQVVEDFRKQYFPDGIKHKFIITNVNRNQSRKDIMRNFMIMGELKKRGRNDIAFNMHMQQEDQGGNIWVMADHFGLSRDLDYFNPDPRTFSAHHGFPVEVVNMIYNASDAVISTTMGEGWGLSVTEAMATKTPVIAPDNTSLTEMLADNRGLLIKSGTNQSMWMLKENDNERIRPIMDVVDAADKIEALVDGKVATDVEGAFNWVRSLDWANIVSQWTPIIKQAAAEAKAEQNPLARHGQLNRQQRRQLARTNA